MFGPHQPNPQHSSFEWRDNRARSPLPADEKLQELLTALDENQVVIYEGSTGVGKTLRNPAAVALEHPDVSIIVLEPTRILVEEGARNIAREAAQEALLTKDPDVKPFVSYRLQGKTKAHHQTGQIDFRVYQSLLSDLKKSENGLPEGIVFIDEAHSNSIELHFLLGLFKERLPHNPNTKLVLQSATPDTETLRRFFETETVVSCSANRFEVKEHSIPLPIHKHHNEIATKKGEEMVEAFSRGELTCLGEVKTYGQCLLWSQDMSQVARAIEKKAEQCGIREKVATVCCHSKSSEEDLALIKEPPPEGTLRFAIGTDYTKEGLTLADSFWGIDSGCAIREHYDHSTGVRYRIKRTVTESEKAQARGRLGRIHGGEYFLVENDDEKVERSKFPKPATETSSLSDTCLTLISMGKSPADFPFPYGIKTEAIESTLRRHEKLGFIDSQRKITELGKKVAAIKATPEVAFSLLTAKKLNVVPEVAFAVTALEERGLFRIGQPRNGMLRIGTEMLYAALDNMDENLVEHLVYQEIDDDFSEIAITFDADQDREAWRVLQHHVRSLFGSETKSDFIAAIELFREFEAVQDDHRKDWCEQHLLNFKTVKRTYQQATRLMKQMKVKDQDKVVTAEREDKIHAALLAGFPALLLHHQERGRYEGQGLENIRVKPVSLAHNSTKRAYKAGKRKLQTKFLLSSMLDRHNPITRQGVDFEYLSDMAAPVTGKALLLGMEQLCEEILERNWRMGQREDSVVQSRLFRYQGHDVKRVFRPAQPSEGTAQCLAEHLLSSDTLPDELKSVIQDNEFVRELLSPIEEQWSLHFLDGITNPKTYQEWLASQIINISKVSDVSPQQIRLGNKELLKEFWNHFNRHALGQVNSSA